MADSAVRWGFIGAGSIAHNAVGPATHAADGAVLYAAASRDPARSATLEPAVVHSGYSELLDDPAVEAVYINLHNGAHRPWVLAALAAGKHVLCEKPLGLNAAETAEMFAAAEAADRLLVEAMWNRWHPRTREAEQLIADGAIGAVGQVVARWENGTAPRAGDYRYVPAFGGGALLDVGCYTVAAALWAFGWQVPEGVTASMQLREGGTDSSCTATLAFPVGAAEISASFTGADIERFAVTGSAGSLELLGAAYSGGRVEAGALRLRTAAGEEETRSWPATNAFQLMVEQVSRAVRGEPAMLIPPAQSLAVATVLDRIAAAAVTPAG
jgi:xylose dehydrogenase (NAD/NADP)